MHNKRVLLITGTRKGIGRYLVEHYIGQGYTVVGCSRGEADFESPDYHHECVDVADEAGVKQLFHSIRSKYGRLDGVINNAGVAAMNLVVLTPMSTVRNILDTNLVGTFLFCREAAKLMQKQNSGRIVNLTTVAHPLRLEGEAVYAASKAAVESITRILAKEVGSWGITVNAVGPTPVQTDLIRGVPEAKIKGLLSHQAIQRLGEHRDVANVIDFFLQPESDFVTGQVVYLGGVG